MPDPYIYPAPSPSDPDRRHTYKIAKEHGHDLETIPTSRIGAGLYVKRCTHEGCDLYIAVEYERATMQVGFDQQCPWARPAWAHSPQEGSPDA